MTTSYPFSGTTFAGSAHPTLDWAVTPDQRARAEDYLQRAYANGRITHDDFERRIAIAIEATTRRELNRAFEGLAAIPTGFPGGVRPSTSLDPYARPGALSRPRGTTLGAAAQLGTIPFPLVGPGAVAAFTRPGTPAHREAAKAFNSTVSAVVLMVAFSMLQHVVHPLSMVTGLLGTLWVVFAVVGAVKANAGENWTNPFTRVLPLRLISEK